METTYILYARINCPSCEQTVETEIKMAVGDTRPRYEYTIGDKCDWNPHASVEGDDVDIEGTSRCPACGDTIPVKVAIRGDIIADVFFDPDRNLSDSIPSPFYIHQPAQAVQIPPQESALPMEPDPQPTRRPLFNFDPNWLTERRKQAVAKLTKLGVDIYAPNPSAKHDEFRIMIPHELHPKKYVSSQ
jgi:hypothetical protein